MEELRVELRRLEGVEDALFEQRDALYRNPSHSDCLKSLEEGLERISESQGKILEELHLQKPKLPNPDDLIRKAEALISEMKSKNTST